jgi:hypothetical protein
MKESSNARGQLAPLQRGAAVTAVLLAALLLPGCSRKETPTVSASENPGNAGPASVQSAAVEDPAPPPQFSGAGALQYVRQVVGFGPRWVGSPGHAKTEKLLRAELQGIKVEEDAFEAATPVGTKAMRNFVAEFPGTREGVVVVAGHYDTLYERPKFVGANDGGSSTGLLLQLARELRSEMKNGRREGYTVRLAWLDGEEAFQQWTDSDSVYGSRHLAQKWQQDGTLRAVKAFLLVDMIGDAELQIDRDTNSTPWLQELVLQAATRYGYQSHFFRRTLSIGDDHVPFAQQGVPVVDLIDLDYGYNNAFWHTPEDTLDKLSAQSLEITGCVVRQTIRLLDRRPESRSDGGK